MASASGIGSTAAQVHLDRGAQRGGSPGMGARRRDPHDGWGVPVDDTDNSLRVGERGPTLLDDFHLREKIMHFDPERIPERVVHARGAAAHGTFRLTTSIEKLTCAPILCDTSVDTRCSSGSPPWPARRGSADTA